MPRLSQTTRLVILLGIGFIATGCSSSTGGTGGGSAGGGSGGGVAGGGGGGGGGSAGADGLTISLYRAAGDPLPVAVRNTYTSSGTRATTTGPDAGTGWYAPLTTGQFTLNSTSGDMTTEARLNYAQSGNVATITLHAKGVAGSDSENAVGTAGLYDMQICYQKAGASKITLTVACSSPTAPSVTGTASAAVTAGLQLGQDYCYYGFVGAIPLGPRMGKSIDITPDSSGKACLNHADNFGIQVVASGGSVTSLAGSGTADAVITITGSGT